MSSNDIGFFEIVKWAHLVWFLVAFVAMIVGYVQKIEAEGLVGMFRRDPPLRHLQMLIALYFLPEVLIIMMVNRFLDDPLSMLKFWTWRKPKHIQYG